VRSLQCLLLVVAALLLVGWDLPRPPVLGRPAPQPLRLPRPLPQRVVDVPILEYHRVGVVAGLPGLTVDPGLFDAEMRWLHGAGYHAISAAQLFAALERGAPLPPRPVMITFDDGYRDILWNAAPLLHRLRMPATAFVIVARVGGPDPSFLDWPELRRLQALGFTIGSHTVHHVELTAVSNAVADSELLDSRLRLGRRLGAPVQAIAYPLGAADDRVAELAARAGYVLGFTERAGSQQSADAPLLLHRDEILPTTGVAGVRALVESPPG